MSEGQTRWPWAPPEPQPPAARRGDPASSHEAARTSTTKRESEAALVLSAIEDYPGLTAAQISKTIGLDAYIVRKRTAALRRLGKVKNQRCGPDGKPISLEKGEVLRWFPTFLR